MNERELFIQLVEIEGEAERASFLDNACANHQEMRVRLKHLLKQHFRQDSFFLDASPALVAVEPDATLAPETPQTGENASTTIPDIILQPGTHVGPYTIQERIGEGGFGIVYVAQQQQPIQRKVALKILKPGMNSLEVISRFEAERQVLALMDHPHVARILDAGTAPSGVPYFVMELVPGIPITDFCDREKLSTTDRLRLLIDVCRAVQHAHQKGIIHRDIKPSNVLVTMHDGQPVAKVIDFGIAKALNQEFTRQTACTAMGQLVGTPMYMSPEQADPAGLDVDTRSDVYSLGVLLYELLTGATPFDAETLRKAGIPGLRHILSETEPPRPSTRVSTLNQEQRSTVCENRQIGNRRIEVTLRGDLDWIAMKALEKDRNRRYGSPAAFAEDIERYLTGQPVEAGPPSRAYRLRKLISGHRTEFGLAGLVVLSLVVGLALALWQARRAQDALVLLRQQEQRTIQAAAEAQANAQETSAQLYAADIRLAHQSLKRGDITGSRLLMAPYAEERRLQSLRGFEWYLLSDDLQVPYRTAFSTPDGCTAMRLLKQGQLIAIGTAKGAIVVLDGSTFQQLRTFHLESDSARGFDLSPDGSSLATINSGGVVTFWNLESGSQTGSFKAHDDDSGYSLYYAEDGETLFTSGHGPHVHVWNVPSGTLKFRIAGAENGQMKNALAWDPTTQMIACADSKGVARVYDPMRQRIVCKLAGAEPATFIRCLKFTHEGRYLVGGRRDNSLCVWDTKTGRIVRQLQGHKEDIQSIDFHPALGLLASSDKGGAVRVWSLKDPLNDSAQSAADLPWPSVFQAHDVRVWSVAFSADGQSLLTCGNEGEVRAWPRRKADFPVLGPPRNWRTAMTSPDAEQIYLLDHEVVCRIDVSAQEHRLLFQQNVADDKLSRFAFLPARNLLICGFESGRLELRDAATGQLLQQATGHQRGITSLRVSPDGTQLLSASADNTVRLWRPENLTELHRVDFPVMTKALSFAPDGKSWLVGINDNFALSDLFGKEPKYVLHGHTNTVTQTEFSLDGSQLLSTGDDRTVRFWNRDTGTLIRSIPVHDIKVRSMVLSPDGKTLVTGDIQGVLSFTHVPTRRYLFSIDLLEDIPPAHIPTTGLAREVVGLAFSTDGRRLIATVQNVGAVILEPELASQPVKPTKADYQAISPVVP